MPIDIKITHKIDERQFKIINIRMIELRKQIDRFFEVIEKFINQD